MTSLESIISDIVRQAVREALSDASEKFFSTDVAQGLRLAREKASMTQEEAAIKSELSRSSIANYEKGRRSPQLKELEKIAKAYNVDVESFLRHTRR